jgi:hypothetical protein
MADPEIIGELYGAVVMINRSDRTVILAHKDMPPVKFSIDHPYIQGTKLERDARAALDTQCVAARCVEAATR